jgi:flagellum-specific peptidoglycan hydrolase FlgJ
MRQVYWTFGAILCFFLFSSHTVDNSKALSEQYIEQYRDLAVIEMHRSGIPASIILAQALVESRYGTSKLATQANNHFGIKCKSYWKGMTYYHKDDDYNKAGKLIDSCFRSYHTAVDSYVDHSYFLMNTPWYKELFSYDKTDYINWAHGLKKCGYATNPKYADLLINKIKQFDLDQYDHYL